MERLAYRAGATTVAQRGLGRLQELGGKQEPFACVLACADSRVPVELLYDQGFGDLFVTRVAGDIATASIIASLEFGTEVLGAHAIKAGRLKVAGQVLDFASGRVGSV